MRPSPAGTSGGGVGPPRSRQSWKRERRSTSTLQDTPVVLLHSDRRWRDEWMRILAATNTPVETVPSLHTLAPLGATAWQGIFTDLRTSDSSAVTSVVALASAELMRPILLHLAPDNDVVSFLDELLRFANVSVVFQLHTSAGVTAMHKAFDIFINYTDTKLSTERLKQFLADYPAPVVAFCRTALGLLRDGTYPSVGVVANLIPGSRRATERTFAEAGLPTPKQVIDVMCMACAEHTRERERTGTSHTPRLAYNCQPKTFRRVLARGRRLTSPPAPNAQSAFLSELAQALQPFHAP